MNLSSLQASGIGEHLGADLDFDSISTDTRNIQLGDVYLALKGPNFDGHNYVQDAVAKGARALVLEKPCDEVNVPQLIVKNALIALGEIAAKKRESFSGTVIGVTGSCGKTTVKGLLKSILSCHSGREDGCVATHGNFNNHIGAPLSLMTIHDKAEYAVIEAGASGSGEISYLANLIKPDIALVNNVMPVHIEGFGSIEAIAKEKMSICDSKTPEGKPSTVIFNLDNAQLLANRSRIQGREMLVFSREQKIACAERDVAGVKACVYASGASKDRLGHARFTLNVEVDGTTQQVPVILAVYGDHNISNALAAASCALASGASIGAIVEGLQQFSGEKGRMQCQAGYSGATVVDDTYNACPDSMRAAIDYLANYPNTVFVCGNMGELGEDEISIHRQLGQYAKQKGIDSVLAIGHLAKYIAEAFGDGAQIFEDKPALVTQLKSQLQADSLVLVKGSRSTKMEEVVQALLSGRELSDKNFADERSQ
ncbi:MAG: UDP-N-acetylmuramoyl-tripeptide--D-alanyl-D-alanine ligase [Alteromonadaceae bacterium]|nr:MAG: UDP-N-acetylmuramoyl-tripeptide--D-alanyl-D-alanine ligase [Alteromonadaceae bacterium]